MKANRVRKGATYVFDPVLMDHEYYRHKGTIVRVIELPGCPRSRMPKCFAHVEVAHTGSVIGMVHTNSLVPARLAKYRDCNCGACYRDGRGIVFNCDIHTLQEQHTLKGSK
jgi:hypothetical protein